MKNIRKILLPVIISAIPVTLVAVWLFTRPTLKESCVDAYDLLKEKEYIGIVEAKYVDYSNHATKTLVILSPEGEIHWLIDPDESGCYEYLHIDDSIIKASDSYDVVIYREGQRDTTFVLDYDCSGL